MDRKTNPAGRRIAATCVLLALSGGAIAGQGGTFDVSVRVVRSDAAAMAIDVPVPPGASLLTQDRYARSYAFPGPTDVAARHFIARGYRVVHASPGATTLAFDDARKHVRVDLQGVLGSPDTTRIVVQADPAG